MERRPHPARLPLSLCVLLLAASSPLIAQSGAAGGSGRRTAATWGTPATRPSTRSTAPTSRISRSPGRFNAANLGPFPDSNFQATPLMVDGVLYTTAGSRRNVVALDAETGEMLWVYRIDEGERGANAIRRLSGRGVAYWTDGAGDERIFLVTIGYQLVALDAATGRPVSGFGTDGIVDLKLGNDQEIDPLTGEIGWNSAPHRGPRRRPRGRLAPGGLEPPEPGERQGVYPRIRCPDRAEAVDLPHDPPGR